LRIGSCRRCRQVFDILPFKQNLERRRDVDLRLSFALAQLGLGRID
jgi:hypothetical protein